MGLSRASFEDIVERVHTVPSLPEAVMQVVKLVNDKNSSAHHVEAIMARDPAMAAKILRMVNSVYYGLREPCNNLEQAIAILGFKTVRSIALSISVINLFQQQDAGFNMKAFWTHGAVCATIGRSLAQRAGYHDPELAFVVGLVKDIGALILVEHAPDELKAIIALAREYRLGLVRATRKLIDTDHVEIGTWLTEHWGLDQAIIDAVKHQNSIADGPDPQLVAIGHLAEYICSLKKLRIAGQCDEFKLDGIVWDHLGFDKTALMEALAEVNDEVDHARRLLDIAQD